MQKKLPVCSLLCAGMVVVMFHNSAQILEEMGTVIKVLSKTQFLYFIWILSHWFLSFIQHLQDKIFCVYFLSPPYLWGRRFYFLQAERKHRFFSSDTAVRKTISQHESINDIVFVA